MPWGLRPTGISLLAVYPVPLKNARLSVPANVPILSFIPGWTLGAVFVAVYGPGSILQYSEMIVVTAAVRHQGKPAWFVNEILVDNQDSLDGGRALLGVPKHLAEFRRDGGTIDVLQDGQPIFAARYNRPWWLTFGRLYVVASNIDVNHPETVRACGNEIEGVAGVVSATITLADRMKAHFPVGPLVTLAGKDVKALLGRPLVE